MKMLYVDTMKYYSAIKKNEILSFATTGMDLEGVMLSDISQMEKDKYHMWYREMEKDKYSYVDSKTNQIAKPKTHTQKTKNKL